MGDMTAGWYDEGESGPPTIEDDMWFHEHVRAAGYPKVKRGDVPMEGQMTLTDTLTRCNWCSQVIAKDAAIVVGALVACTPLCARYLR